ELGAAKPGITTNANTGRASENYGTAPPGSVGFVFIGETKSRSGCDVKVRHHFCAIHGAATRRGGRVVSEETDRSTAIVEVDILQAPSQGRRLYLRCRQEAQRSSQRDAQDCAHFLPLGQGGLVR